MERYQDNLKNKVIEFQGKHLYVVDQTEYNGDYYIYTFNAEKFNSEDELEINILKKIGNDNIEVITDMHLFDKILGIFGMRVFASEIKKLQ